MSGLSTGCVRGPVAASNDEPGKAARSAKFGAGEAPKCTFKVLTEQMGTWWPPENHLLEGLS